MEFNTLWKATDVLANSHTESHYGILAPARIISLLPNTAKLDFLFRSTPDEQRAKPKQELTQASLWMRAKMCLAGTRKSRV